MRNFKNDWQIRKGFELILKLETIQRVVNEASKEYSDVIYLGISSNLSGTAGAIRTMATELGNVYIMENHLIGDQITRTAEYLKNLYENHNYTIDQLYEELNWINESVMNLIVLWKNRLYDKRWKVIWFKKICINQNFNATNFILWRRWFCEAQNI
ncbi:DegV family protein [Mycoplasmopsis cynos]|uniref:DegV family protein n=1 Tax=Mycoplasmopsis cynos TaxID=171284 RepID=UPI002FEF4E83